MNDETILEEQVKPDEQDSQDSDIETAGVVETNVETETEEPASPPSLEEQLESVQAEAVDYKDRWMRGQAEFSNARKRMDKQRIQTYQNATVELAAKILPAIDDFERAMENVPLEINENDWFEGLQLVQRKFATILEGINVTTIKAVGQQFDPNWHEAVMQEPSDEVESGMVTKELQKGYKIDDRVIRPSLVCVAQ